METQIQNQTPWTEEPDRKHWIDPSTNLDCLIVRNPVGALCGYVGVPPDHPWFNKHYDEIEASVHGGLTFSGACSNHICHDAKKETVANENVWWLGFDCAHVGDFTPKLEEFLFSFNNPANYRDIKYVSEECVILAIQAVKAWDKEDDTTKKGS